MNGLLKRFSDNIDEVMQILLKSTLSGERMHDDGEVQRIKKFLKSIDHNAIKDELNDILHQRENETRVLEIIHKFYWERNVAVPG
jgi:hypothetical protein